MKGILTLFVFLLMAFNTAMAQTPGYTKVSRTETFKTGYQETDDYKHAHFNQAIHERNNYRIVVEKECSNLNHNYHQQAGTSRPLYKPASVVKERDAYHDDPVVQERDYKHMGSIF